MKKKLKDDHNTIKTFPQTCHLVALQLTIGKVQFERGFYNINTEALVIFLYLFTLINTRPEPCSTKRCTGQLNKKKHHPTIFFCVKEYPKSMFRLTLQTFTFSCDIMQAFAIQSSLKKL